MKLPSLTVSIPAYNEEKSLPAVIVDVLKYAPLVATKFELLLVNDGSTDNTMSIMKDYAKNHKEISIIEHKQNKGFSGAIKSCYQHAKYEWIFLAPADGQVGMDVLHLFTEKTIHADVVVGYRTTNPEPFSRKLNSFMFHLIYRIIFGINLKEISTAILWKKKVLKQINITALDRSALIQPEVIYKAWKNGARFTDVGFPYHMRTSGIPKGGDPTMIVMTIKEMIRLYKELRIQP